MLTLLTGSRWNDRTATISGLGVVVGARFVVVAELFGRNLADIYHVTLVSADGDYTYDSSPIAFTGTQPYVTLWWPMKVLSGSGWARIELHGLKQGPMLSRKVRIEP